MTAEFQALDAAESFYFDGDAPIPKPVSLAFDGAHLRIDFAEGQVLWPAEEIRQVSDVAGRAQYILRWTGDPLARLVTPNPFVLRALPRANRPAPPKGRGRLAAWAVAAVAAVTLQIAVLIPLLADNLAGFIPPSGERALGEATLGHIREALDETGLTPLAFCTETDGTVALNQMVTTLTSATAFEEPPSVFVLDHQMINAFALPGGIVVLFRGLIEAAETPDQVAAVLAHELGHVASRDPTRHALRSAGSIGVLGLLFGDFAGGAAVLFMAERLISAQYAQSAEADADTYAHGLLEAANVSPGALGDMFATMRDKFGDAHGISAHFLSHPALSARIKSAHLAVDEDRAYDAILNANSWAALQDICG